MAARPGVRRTRVRDRGRRRGAEDLLRGPGPASRGRRGVRRQRRLPPRDGQARHADRGPRRTRLPAPRSRLGGRCRGGHPRRGVAGETSLTRRLGHPLAGPVTSERLTWPARTERLSFRPAEISDLPAVFAYRSLEDVGQWMPGRPSSYDEWLVQMDPEAMGRTLVLELDGAVIGDLYLHVEDGWAQHEVREGAERTQAEIGWCLSPVHQGRGYVTEAVTELVRICFEDLAIRRVAAVAFADNVPSLRVMDKLGMQREALFRRESLHRDLGWVDSVTYALLVDDWRERLPG